MLHLSPANGSHSWVERPLRVVQPDDQLPAVGPHTYGMSIASGAPSPSRSPTMHRYVMFTPSVASWGAFAIATVRAIRDGGRRGRALDREILRAGERAEVDGVLQHLAFVVETADIDREGHGAEAGRRS